MPSGEAGTIDFIGYAVGRSNVPPFILTIEVTSVYNDRSRMTGEYDDLTTLTVTTKPTFVSQLEL
jgi:hypothetical protein